MQSGPDFRLDLTIVIEGPTGEFVSFCGMWYEPVQAIAYVEPLATDPDFRRLGLGQTALAEGIQRCQDLGATEAFVGSDQAIYSAAGFTKLHESSCWLKRW
jgi:predicted N-acetyltransferase YhbS